MFSVNTSSYVATELLYIFHLIKSQGFTWSSASVDQALEHKSGRNMLLQNLTQIRFYKSDYTTCSSRSWLWFWPREKRTLNTDNSAILNPPWRGFPNACCLRSVEYHIMDTGVVGSRLRHRRWYCSRMDRPQVVLKQPNYADLLGEGWSQSEQAWAMDSSPVHHVATEACGGVLNCPGCTSSRRRRPIKRPGSL